MKSKPHPTKESEPPVAKEENPEDPIDMPGYTEVRLLIEEGHGYWSRLERGGFQGEDATTATLGSLDLPEGSISVPLYEETPDGWVKAIPVGDGVADHHPAMAPHMRLDVSAVGMGDRADSRSEDTDIAQLPENIQEWSTMCFNFIRTFADPKNSRSVVRAPSKRATMGPQKGGPERFTLVLDLDHVLVLSLGNRPKETYRNALEVTRPDWAPSVKLMNGDVTWKCVWFRPGLLNFLKAVSQLYEVAIFSAGSEHYVQSVVQQIDPERKYIDQVFSREHVHGYRVDDVSKPSVLWLKIKDVGGFFEGSYPRSEKRVVIVDDVIAFFVKQLANVVPIAPFLGDSGDRELDVLLEFLKSLVRLDDVRLGIKNRFNLQRHLENYCGAGGFSYPMDI
eukprot:jgi/Botrbrau1/12183/Bobra.0186s0090.2